VLIDFDAVGMSRGQVARALEERGIRSQVHYIPVHRQPLLPRALWRADPAGAEALSPTFVFAALRRMTMADVDGSSMRWVGPFNRRTSGTAPDPMRSAHATLHRLHRSSSSGIRGAPSKVLAPLADSRLAHICDGALRYRDRSVGLRPPRRDRERAIVAWRRIHVAIYRGAERSAFHFVTPPAQLRKGGARVTSDVADRSRICGRCAAARRRRSDYAAKQHAAFWPMASIAKLYHRSVEEADVDRDRSGRSRASHALDPPQRAFRRVNLAGPAARDEQRWSRLPGNLAFLSALYERIGQVATDPSWTHRRLVDRETQLALITEARKQR